MFALLSAHFSLLLISFILPIATQPFADNLFTDWTSSDLNDVTISDSNSQFLPGDTNTDQLLAFNNDPASNMFTSDSLTSDFSTSDSLNQASTDPPLDMSNTFLDSTPLDSLDTTAFDPSVSYEQALPDLLGDLSGSDAYSPDLLADNASGGCSFSPSSPSRKSRKRENTCQAPSDSHGAGDKKVDGFFQKTAAEQAEAYKKLVCPSAHWGKAVSIPVCSSADPTKTVRMGPYAPVFPDSDTLADSTLCQSFIRCCSFLSHRGELINLYQILVFWYAASNCVGGARRPYCCQDWSPSVFLDQLLPNDAKTVSFLIIFNLFDSSDRNCTQRAWAQG